MAVGELLRGAEAVKLGRLLEGQIVGFARLAVGQTFLVAIPKVQLALDG
jgi:hypothetical protein